MTESDNSTRRRPVRWWPLWVIGILAVLALVFVWEFRDAYRQEKNIFSAIISMITLGLMLLWWTFFSRIKWKLRLGVILVVAVMVGIGSQAFEIIGVSGDLIPIIRLKSGGTKKASVEKVVVDADVESLPRAEQDFLQFLGPSRDAVLAGISLTQEQMQTPPMEL